MYDRPRHLFTDKDAVRVLRALLDQEVQNPGLLLAEILVVVFRTAIGGIRLSGKVRDFVFNFLRGFFPKFLQETFQRLGEAEISLLVWLGELVTKFITDHSREKEPVDVLPIEGGLNGDQGES